MSSSPRDGLAKLYAKKAKGYNWFEMIAPTLAKTKVKVTIPKKRLADFCRRWKVSELALFGSTLQNDFHATSDVDLLVSFAPSAKVSLFDLVRMQNELKEIFGREVDLVERRAIEKSENYIRRKSILENTKVIYAAQGKEPFMRWTEVRKAYPDQWLVIEALKAHSKAERRVLDKIAVVEVCADGTAALQSYRKLHQSFPEREYYFVHTRRAELDIRERQWLGIRRGYAPAAPR